MLTLPLSLTPNPIQAGGYGIQGFAGAFVSQIHRTLTLTITPALTLTLTPTPTLILTTT